MSKAGGRRRDEFTVRIIDTHFVQTDPYSFKSVVQSLTGKDSMNSMAAAPAVGAPLPSVAEPLIVVVGDDNGAKHEEDDQECVWRDIWVEDLDMLLNFGQPIMF